MEQSLEKLLYRAAKNLTALQIKVEKELKNGKNIIEKAIDAAKKEAERHDKKSKKV